MLKRLHIENYALIEELDIQLESGFTVITGETGAGKSILLGAIALLLGGRADSHSILKGADKCVVEAEFDGYHIMREVTVNGRSKASVNGKSASIGELKVLGDKLIDIHSQHQNLLLSKEDFQMQVLDLLEGTSLTDYTKAYDKLVEADEQLKNAKEAMHRSREDEEYMRYQLEELDNFSPTAGEDEVLDEELRKLSHAEDIKSGLSETYELLDNDEAGALDTLRQAERTLSSIADVCSSAEELSERISSTIIELRDIADTLSSEADDIDIDPQRLQEVQERLDQLNTLEHKHHVSSSEELVVLWQELQKKLSIIDDADVNIEELKRALAIAKEAAGKEADKLTAKRRKAAALLHQEMETRLRQLGMPNIRFEVMITRGELQPTGQDRIVYLFQANKNAPLLPISEIASGGEVARVMLAIKALISGKVTLPTIIFDEIDTGTSGQMAQQMGYIMQEMGREGRQVVSITHLPQIAACGQHHLKVWKQDTEDATRSHISVLTTEDRVQELAHMLSGSKVTKAAIENAKSLLNV